MSIVCFSGCLLVFCLVSGLVRRLLLLCGRCWCVFMVGICCVSCVIVCMLSWCVFLVKVVMCVMMSWLLYVFCCYVVFCLMSMVEVLWLLLRFLIVVWNLSVVCVVLRVLVWLLCVFLCVKWDLFCFCFDCLLYELVGGWVWFMCLFLLIVCVGIFGMFIGVIFGFSLVIFWWL